MAEFQSNDRTTVVAFLGSYAFMVFSVTGFPDPAEGCQCSAVSSEASGFLFLVSTLFSGNEAWVSISFSGPLKLLR